MAKRYSKQAIADPAAYQKKLEKTQTYFTPESEVFEFGCGTGSTAIIHAPYVKHIFATDGSAKMIQIAKDKAAAKNIQNITFEVSTIEADTLPEGAYDVVLGMSILHLLKDKEAVIARVYDSLKPGGVFISSTVVMDNPNIFIRLLGKVGGVFGLVLRLFSSKDLQQSLTNAGFEIDYEWLPEGDGTRAVFIVAKKHTR